MKAARPAPARRWHAAEVFLAFLRLGLFAFGGPIAHLGYFRREFVERRRWLDDAAYADLVALCQFLPGPASSQVGIALGTMRAGIPGAVGAWIGFTLPSALIMIAAGYGLRLAHGAAHAGWLHGLKIAAVAVVAQAVWSMGRRLCAERRRAGLALLAALLVLLWPGAPAQLAAIAGAAFAGWLFLEPALRAGADGPLAGGLGRRGSAVVLVLFLALLIVLPLLARIGASHALDVLDRFYRSGALVFGGGHVVLPLLRAQVVPPGWVSDNTFLAGYGIAQALPGPLFSFAAYLGTVARGEPSGWAGGLLALSAIYLPAFLLVLGAMPHWSNWRAQPAVRAALDGVNAAVVGILLAALYDPIFVSSVHGAADFALALAALGLLVWGRVPPLGVVIFCALGGAALGAWF